MSLRLLSRRPGSLLAAGALAVGTLSAIPALTAGAAAGSSASSADWAACLSGPTDRQAVFQRASAASGVPVDVLLAVSYMESRWDAHGSAPSSAGGYGPMNLTDIPHLAAGSGDAPDPDPLGKGDPSSPHGTSRLTQSAPARDGVETLRTAHSLTKIPVAQLRSDAVANICGGAAVLASYQKAADGADDLGDWAAAVARYSGASDQPTALRFVRQVFGTLRTGAARTTNDGDRVELAPRPSATADRAKVEALGMATPAQATNCPARLECESVPAPYEWYDTSSPGNYGNYDLADRPKQMKIDYIVIHDTEATWDTTLNLVQDPTYLGWHYTLRSADGLVASHIDPKNVGWHAGNWYVNSHSIGIEHEGFAPQGAQWFTEAMYENSATLVRYLAAKYDIPLDRAHIIGHDQVPGVAAGSSRSMHWDPGPYWDWGHYFDLLKAPIKPDRHGRSDVWTVDPDFATNVNTVTSCETAGDTCPDQGSNFVYLHTAPSEDAPLIPDAGLYPGGSNSTTGVSDWGARAAAGQKVVVDKRQGEWWAVWFGGQLGWIHNPKDHPVLVPASGTEVKAKDDTAVPVYGRAYPERSAYPSTIPYQTVSPMEYKIQPGQAYVLADPGIETDYYYAKTFQCAYVADDCTDVKGADKYYEIWYNHRIGYVRAADVTLTQSSHPAHPATPGHR